MTYEYRHPKKYEGVKPDNERGQLWARLYVERNCLKCSEFMGQNHDFSACAYRNRRCPEEYIPVLLINPTVKPQCEIDE